MKSLTINKIVISSIPENWNELTKEQLLSFCRTLRYATSLDVLLVHFFLILSGLKFGPRQKPLIIDEIPYYFLKHRNTKDTLCISVQDILYAMNSLSFLFSIDQERTIIQSRLFQNLLPSIRVKGINLYGPESALFNITLDEFIRCETNFEKYKLTNDDAWLNRLIAVLYRRPDPHQNTKYASFSGDRRIVFNDYLVDNNISLVSAISPEYKLAILLFYEGSRWFIMRGSNEFNIAFDDHIDKTDNNKTTFQNFMDLVTALSNDDVTRMSIIRKTLLYDILYQLKSLAERQIKTKANV